MKFAERLKTDKNFRWKVILIFVAVVIILGNSSSTQKQFKDPAVCDQFDIDFLGYTDEIPCQDSGCFVTKGVLNVGRHCISCGASGDILQKGAPSPSFSCCSGSGEILEDGSILCRASPPDDTGKTSACETKTQKSLASIADTIGLGELECKTKYYMVAGGGGFLAMIIMLAVL